MTTRDDNQEAAPADSVSGTNPKPFLKPRFILLYYWLILAAPLFIYGFPHSTHDGEIHARWYANFARQFWSGDLYPRWLIEMNDGFASPAFFFYPPVPYWVSSIFYLLPGDAAQAWRQLGLSAALGLLLSGVTMRLWLKEITTPRAALAGAILYMAAPYHLAVDLYTRGAFAEFWAFVWLPLILYFTHRVVWRKPFALPGLAVSYALLVMTHLPTVLIFSIAPLLYALVISQPLLRFKTLVAAGSGLALGAGLACVYLVPALLSQDAVSMQAMRTGHLYYENAFFFPHFSGKIARGPFDLSVFRITLVMCGLSLCSYLLMRRSASDSEMRLGTLWFCLAWFGVFMMTPVSKPVWVLFPKLQLVQFPWRFHVLLTVAIVALMALALGRLRFPKGPGALALNVTGCFLLLLWIPITVKQFPASPQRQSFRYIQDAESQRRGNDVPEYRPSWAESTPKDRATLFASSGQPEYYSKILSGNGAVGIEKWAPGRISISVDAATEASIAIRQFYFPGWRAFDLASRQEFTVLPTQPDGLISIRIPEGRYQIGIRLSTTWPEIAGQAFSAISFIGVIALAWPRRAVPG
jgi:hypothetical protein